MSSYSHTLTKNPKSDRRLPWIEKYRPQHIDQVISHPEIISSLKKFISLRTLPNLLFFGPSGSGKTSTIKCCGREIYGEYMHTMVLELNASNERGIETVRTKIKNFVSNKNSFFLPLGFRDIFKLVILDEIDSMTVEAQGMLRQTIEKNSKTTRFCLICNDIDKIHIALQSRCALFRFAPLCPKDMINRLDEICNLEKIKYDNGTLETIIKITKGDMRAAINTLQHIKMSINRKVTSYDIYKNSGYCMPEIIDDIFTVLINYSMGKTDMQYCVDVVNDMVIENNITIFNLLEELKNVIMKSDFSNAQKIYLIDNFAQNEIYDSVNVDQRNIIMILSGLFLLARSQ